MKQRLLLTCAIVAYAMMGFAQLPTANEIARNMYPGWNLGNTMEAGSNANNFTNDGGLAAEMSWQKTKTSQAVIDAVKAQGFKSVRIPAAWVMGHVNNSTDVKIDADWMARVKEIVDYCINDGLYVVLNDHWDGGWLEENVSTYDAGRAKILKNIWTQIATEFRDYDEHLLFAGLNEPNASNQTATTNLIKYEQDFIDAVRATGGNNATRTLVVQGPSTNIDNTEKYYTAMPVDKVSGRLMMEVHYYDPPQFTGVWENNQPFWFWGSANHIPSGTYAKYNSTYGEESAIQSQFDKMCKKFVDKGYPVILGEFAANWRAVGNTSAQKKHDASIKLYYKLVCQYAIERGLVPFVWDVNVASQNGTTGIMTVIDRNNGSVYNTPGMEGIKEGVAAAKWAVKSTYVTAIDDVKADDANPCLDPSRPVYNLSGQRVSAATKGVLIQGGRKYLVR